MKRIRSIGFALLFAGLVLTSLLLLPLVAFAGSHTSVCFSTEEISAAKEQWRQRVKAFGPGAFVFCVDANNRGNIHYVANWGYGDMDIAARGALTELSALGITCVTQPSVSKTHPTILKSQGY